MRAIPCPHDAEAISHCRQCRLSAVRRAQQKQRDQDFMYAYRAGLVATLIGPVTPAELRELIGWKPRRAYKRRARP